MKAVHLLIKGHVQRVGFRHWLARQAEELQLHGWVRNVGQDMVEAVVAGDETAVDMCQNRCRTGPSGAHVTTISVSVTTMPQNHGFVRMCSIPDHR